MQSFVYRLVERLTGDGPALSRNRHFHVFGTPEGREALRIARHLRSVAEDIAATGRAPRCERVDDRMRIEVPVHGGMRTAWLCAEEWELLRRMPSVRAVFGDA